MALDMSWMLAYLRRCNLRVVHPQEIQVLARYMRGECLDSRESALVVLILESSQFLNLKLSVLESVLAQAGMSVDAHTVAMAWPARVKGLLSPLLTDDQRFEEHEVDFLLTRLLQDYLEVFRRGDKSKSYGPYANRTFWAELAFEFNVRFYRRRRGVVAIRNKIKNLLASPDLPMSPGHRAMVHALVAERQRLRGGSDDRVIEPINAAGHEDNFRDDFAQEVFMLLLSTDNEEPTHVSGEPI